jgi:hypothetical protein
MMGNKTLSTIREELRAALGETATDPIAWLEERIAAKKHHGAGATDVLESLKRVLEAGTKKKRRKRAAGAKK